jgi:hypothetical protein
MKNRVYIALAKHFLSEWKSGSDLKDANIEEYERFISKEVKRVYKNPNDLVNDLTSSYNRLAELVEKENELADEKDKKKDRHANGLALSIGFLWLAYECKAFSLSGMMTTKRIGWSIYNNIEKYNRNKEEFRLANRLVSNF